MIKLRKGGAIVLGLSDLNMLRLKMGDPIKFQLRDLGADLPDITVYILNGRTEESMEANFKDQISAATKVERKKGASEN